MRFCMLPYTALTRKMFSAKLALVFFMWKKNIIDERRKKKKNKKWENKKGKVKIVRNQLLLTWVIRIKQSINMVCMYMYAHISYLILGFSQMFCLMGNHFFIGIKALGKERKRRKKKLKHDENDDLCIKNGLHSSRSWYELKKKISGGRKI